jgi:hypothetical protein
MGKKWQKPELVVLTRSNPEEVVLAACKTGASSGTGGPGYTQACCLQFMNCSICSDSTGS